MNPTNINQPPRRTLLPSLLLSGLAVVVFTFAGCDRPPNPGAKPAPAPGVAKLENDGPQLISQLASLNVTNGPVSAEPAAAWKQTLDNLGARGPAAVPAIRDFLLKNVDLNFEPAGNAAVLGVPTLRLALLGALTKIGGAESFVLAQDVFRATADPLELVEVAKLINAREPGKHRREFAAAARETLALAASGNWDGRDVAPLFEMLRTFGGTNDVAELERYGNTWFAYTAVTIARWPEGAGLPTLIKLVQNVDGRITLGREYYLRMLTDLALSSPAAAEALAAEVHRNSIGVDFWPGLGRTLVGASLHLPDYFPNPASPAALRHQPRSYHLSFGNQNLIEASLPDDAPPRDLGARINLVDRLLENTTNPAAIDAFETARIALSARLPKTK